MITPMVIICFIFKQLQNMHIWSLLYSHLQVLCQLTEKNLSSHLPLLKHFSHLLYNQLSPQSCIAKKFDYSMMYNSKLRVQMTTVLLTTTFAQSQESKSVNVIVGINNCNNRSEAGLSKCLRYIIHSFYRTSVFCIL